MMMKLSEIYTLFKQPFTLEKDIDISHVKIDSRILQPGDLFVAIRGENYDGHTFIEEAKKKGAVAAIVSKPIQTTLPLIQVDDTLFALGQIAKYWRDKFTLPVVALTGSCGKTTTKTILANILAHCAPTLSTQGTLNNDIGVPLTLLNLTDKDQYAVIELGANHAGEIAYTAALASPQIGLITNIAPVHLEGFGSIDGVAHAKSEIYQALPPNGIAILNHDEPYYEKFKMLMAAHKSYTFGINRPSHVMATQIENLENGLSRFNLHYGKEIHSVTLPLLGQHNIMNALAAACVAYALEVPLKKTIQGIETVAPPSKRMNRYQTFNDGLLIDDTYNANPTAFFAAIDFLAQHSGRKILVVGDMGELGPEAEYYHAQVGEHAQLKGIDHLYSVGILSAHATYAFGENAQHFENKNDLIAHLKKNLTSGDIVLVKGSRSAKMEDVVMGIK